MAATAFFFVICLALWGFDVVDGRAPWFGVGIFIGYVVSQSEMAHAIRRLGRERLEELKIVPPEPDENI